MRFPPSIQACQLVVLLSRSCSGNYIIESSCLQLACHYIKIISHNRCPCPLTLTDFLLPLPKFLRASGVGAIVQIYVMMGIRHAVLKVEDIGGKEPCGM